MRYLSVCSGIEAATVAWHRLGWTPVAFSEIEAFPSAVLAHHYPSVPNWGDMTRFKEWPDAIVDILVGGTPCQSFSVAGLRKGLDDPRGNLMLTYLAIARRYRPKWLVWENVPGVLSSNGGRDFAAFLRGLEECGYGFAYRVLDAQYFGLAQRRKRVFVVGCLGDWRRAAAVLLERAGLSGHPAPRRETRERLAPTLAARTHGGGGLGTEAELDGALIPSVAPTLGDCSNGGGANGPGRTVDTAERLVPVPHSAISPALKARDSKGPSSDGDGDGDGAILMPMFAHSLRGDGFDGSEDGTGRGTPIVPVAYGIRSDASRDGEAHTPSADAQGRVRLRAPGFNVYAEHAPTLDAGMPHAIAFDARQSDVIQYGNQSGPLDTDGHSVAVAFDTYNQAASDVAHRLRVATDNGLQSTPHVMHAMQVRRLTPRECERLQGFPDDYTLIPYRNKTAADGPRYKALGNSFAVPVVAWIGKRIAMVEEIAP